MKPYTGVIPRYREFLPVTKKTPVISLQEGNTPLIFSSRISALLGTRFRVYLKYEGLNPTGSFKDRGMTVAISKAKEQGAKAVICASTGNTSASAAAYGARAGIPCIVVIPEGAIAMGKLAQALIYRAKVIAVKGNFDDALRIVREISSQYPAVLVNSINPFRIEGQKTASFEICDFLGTAPHFHSLPVGNAGNITAYWKGYKEYYSQRKISHLPRMLGFQAHGASPIVRGAPVKKPETVATAIRIGNPASWQGALDAREESQGLIQSVTDQEILAAYEILAHQEGVFVEPASAASVAGLLKISKQGYFEQIAGKEITVSCTLTGHGLKDPQIAIKNIQPPPVVAAETERVAAAAGI
ncbi:MAG: threonine synthase [Candidatus Omnitrophica bacterium]|nr:threonine synthase [Candidatus Omnitrophota bacterium]